MEFLTIEFHSILFYLDVIRLYIFSSKPFYIICLINFMKKIHLHKSYVKYLRRSMFQLRQNKSKWWKVYCNLNVIRKKPWLQGQLHYITCNLKHVRLQITFDYMKKCNRLQPITITPCLSLTHSMIKEETILGEN